MSKPQAQAPVVDPAWFTEEGWAEWDNLPDDEQNAPPIEDESVQKPRKGALKLSELLPEGIELAFCPTGPGGGIDATCPPSSKGKGKKKVITPEHKALRGLISRANGINGKPLSDEEWDELKRLWKVVKPEEKLPAEWANKGTGTEVSAAIPVAKVKKFPVVNDKRDEVAISKDQKSEAAKMIKAQEKYVAKINDEAQEAAFYYHHNSSDINREAVNFNESQDALSPEMMDLDKAIVKAPALTSELVVERGMTNAGFLSKLGVGATFQEKRYMSTSLSKEVAKKFTGDDTKQNRAILSIRLPKGTRGLYIDALKSLDKDMEAGEEELLLPRNSIFTVISNSVADDGIRQVSLELKR